MCCGTTDVIMMEVVVGRGSGSVILYIYGVHLTKHCNIIYWVTEDNKYFIYSIFIDLYGFYL